MPDGECKYFLTNVNFQVLAMVTSVYMPNCYGND